MSGDAPLKATFGGGLYVASLKIALKGDWKGMYETHL